MCAFIQKDQFDDCQFGAERERLGQIVQSDETSYDFETSEDTLFAKFVLPESRCYMHSPIVLQHYLDSDSLVQMLDMVAYFRKFLSSAALEDRIWKDPVKK
jgi:hypothetical protein